MRKLIYSISLVLMLAVCLQAASAITDLGGVKVNTCIQLPQTCPSCTYNNISIVQLPDKTYALKGEYAMQKVGASYNYTFCNTNQQGQYFVDGHGDISGTDTGWGGYTFEVTPSGFTNILGYFVIAFILVYLVGLIGFFGKNEIVSVIGGLMMISLGVYCLINGIDIYRNVFTYAVSLWTIGLGAFFSISGGMALIE